MDKTTGSPKLSRRWYRAGIVFTLCIVTYSYCDLVMAVNPSATACSSIKKNAERLRCYDEQSKAALPATPLTVAPAAPVTGGWILKSDTDAITGKSTFFARLPAVKGADITGNPYQLAVRCADGVLSLFIGWGTFLQSDQDVYVTWRFDDQASMTNPWAISSDHASTFTYATKYFFERITSARTFAARVEPYESGPITAVFNLDGSREALTPALACIQ